MTGISGIRRAALLACGVLGMAWSAEDAAAQRLTTAQIRDATVAQLVSSARDAQIDVSCQHFEAILQELRARYWAQLWDGSSLFRGSDEMSTLRRLEAEGCPRRSSAQRPAAPPPRSDAFFDVGGVRFVAFESSAGVAGFRAPAPSFIGVQNPGTQERRLLQFNSDSADTGSQFSGALTFGGLPNPFGAAAGTFTLGGFHSRFLQSTFLDPFDPGTDNLLLFGTGVDPFGPGFIVPPGGGTFNDVTGYRYSRLINRWTLYGRYVMSSGQWGSGVETAIVGQFGYTRTNIDISESGFLPNVPLDFVSTVDLAANTYTPAIGVQITVPLSSSVALQGEAWAGPAFSYGSGRDGFSFSGFFTGTQENRVSGSHVGFAGGASGGVVVTLGGGNRFSVVGSYLTSDSHPVIVRTGAAGERSRIAFESEEKWSVVARWQRNFYP